MAALNTYVHVRDEHGVNHVFGPEDKVPGWAVSQITNTAVWDGSAPKGAPLSSGSTAGTSGDVTEPPRSGTGSGVKAWKTYAESKGITVPDDATRDDVIALVEASTAPESAGDENSGGVAGGSGTGIPSSDATVEEWVAYAAANGLEVEADDDATVEDIIKVLDANEVKTK